MTFINLRNLFAAPPIAGVRALPWAIAAVAIPTLIRASLDDIVVGVAMIPYLPFVLASAIFLALPHAAFVVVVAAAVADAIFLGPSNRFLEGPTDVAAIGFFLLASAMILALVYEIRKIMAAKPPVGQAPEAASGIIFSLEGGQAWASWYGSGPAIRLGPQEEVAEMMEDFLAQLELGKRLAG